MGSISNLVIVGNGLDLHHGLLSKYKAFYESDSLYPDTKAGYDVMISKYRKKVTWFDFEEEYRSLIYKETEIMSKEGYVSGKTGLSEANNKIFLPRIKRINDIFQDILKQFEMYLNEEYKNKSLNFALDDNVKRFLLSSDKIINFNYTHTLQDLYDIEDSRIISPHGTLNNGIILGHSNFYNQTSCDKYGLELALPKLRESTYLGDKNLQRIEKWNGFEFKDSEFLEPNPLGVGSNIIFKVIDNKSSMSYPTIQKVFESPFKEIIDDCNKLKYYNPLALDFSDEIEIVVIGHGLESDRDLLSKIPSKVSKVTLFQRKGKELDSGLCDRAKQIFRTNNVEWVEYSF